jgi:hypothetical protein
MMRFCDAHLPEINVFDPSMGTVSQAHRVPISSHLSDLTHVGQRWDGNFWGHNGPKLFTW